MVDIFSMREASMFARALAGGQGISVEEAQGSVIPVSRKDGTIIIGEPSIYDADEYMGNLHREISKQTQDMKFFFEVDDTDEFTAAARDILQGQRTEYNRRGEFQGRDKILSKHYADTCKKNGGISDVISRVEESSPTLAAMVAIGNDLRNDWQGYQNMEVSSQVQQEMDRLSFLREEWLKLDSKESLETLIKRIQHEQADSSTDTGTTGSSDEGTSEGSTDEQPSSEEGSGEGGSGQPGDGGEDSESSGEDQGAEGEGKDGGEQSGGSEETSEGQKPGSQRDEPRDDTSGSRASSDNPEVSGGEQGAEDTDGVAYSVGATKASQSLEDMGFTKKPIEDYQDAPRNFRVPYASQGDKDLQEITIDHRSVSEGDLLGTITKEIGSFVLSKKMKKYFVAMKQTGYAYGLKRGKLCSKNMYRVATGGAEPPIFKKKLATRVEQDAAIFILGDCSGSMNMYGRYITSAACQVSMSEVLQSMSIPHMMMQFSTNYICRCHYLMKTFAENRVSREVLIKRYASRDIRMGCNADGEAVIAASQYLAKMPQKNKLLIVLSDGEPAYMAGDEQFLRDVVSKIEESKAMNIIGVGIDTDVNRYYTYSKKITQLKDLEGVLLSILRDVIIK